jgi:CHAD domain-containing protein
LYVPRKSIKEDIFFKMLKPIKKNSVHYSTKLKIDLNPGMRSDEAAKIILQYLQQTIKINEIYIKKDIDAKFLHNFRIAVRRTRSALGQIKSVFPRKITSRFKKDFTFVGKLTNLLRDLDVCILKEERYIAALPAMLQDDIAPLFEHLKKIRFNTLQEVTAQLESNRYLHIVNEWETFLTQPHLDLSKASNAKVPILNLAQKIILKQYRTIVKAGNKMAKNQEEEELHALRIKCKKLRYLMEFFSSLFPDKEIRKLIKQVKKLQSNLGHFNDMHVQINLLKDIAGQLPAEDSKSKKTLVAIESLIRTLDREKQETKKAFSKIFMDFATSKNENVFHKLFTS